MTETQKNYIQVLQHQIRVLEEMAKRLEQLSAGTDPVEQKMNLNLASEYRKEAATYRYQIESWKNRSGVQGGLNADSVEPSPCLEKRSAAYPR